MRAARCVHLRIAQIILYGILRYSLYLSVNQAILVPHHFFGQCAFRHFLTLLGYLLYEGSKVRGIAQIILYLSIYQAILKVEFSSYRVSVTSCALLSKLRFEGYSGGRLTGLL